MSKETRQVLSGSECFVAKEMGQRSRVHVPGEGRRWRTRHHVVRKGFSQDSAFELNPGCAEGHAWQREWPIQWEAEI